jgi:membrane-associated phospholipid phosphatase
MSKLYQKTFLATAITLIVYLFLFYFLDRQIDTWVHIALGDTWVPTVGKAVSALATGTYIKLALAVVFTYIFITDPAITKTTTRKLLFISLSISVAILIGAGFKYLLARYRPVMLFEEQLYGLHFFSTEWALNSTPSGHTCRAFAFFTALSLLFKRYATPFLFTALLIGISRVAVTAHYPSDVLFGAYIGTVTAIWIHRIVYLLPEESHI